MFCSLDQFSEIFTACQRSKVGKLLPDVSVHISALQALDPLLQDYESEARQIAPDVERATLVKFNLGKPSISYLFYPEFDANPHLVLQTSIQVNLTNREVNHQDYSNSVELPG